jgi:hypothetical protein
MSDNNKVIHIWDQYRPRKSDDTTTAIRQLLLRRKFATGERVCNETGRGIVIEVSPSGDQVRVLWDHGNRDQWHDVLDVYRVQNL